MPGIMQLEIVAKMGNKTELDYASYYGFLL